MSSEASPTGHGPDFAALQGLGSSAYGVAGWHSIEQRVLLTKLQLLEERAREFEQLQRRLRDLSHEVQLLHRLTEAGRAIHAARDIHQLFETTLGRCMELVHAEAASILLHEAEAEQLVLAKACGPGAAALEGIRVPVGQGVAGYVAAQRQPLLVADIAGDGRFPVRNSGRYATGSFLCVPVLADGELLAVLSVADRGDGESFAGEALRALVHIAQDLATAIERLRRMDASRDSLRQFVSKLAHELRNPLDGVLRFINLTLADHHPEERRRRYLLASKQGLERLTGIVDSLTGLCGREAAGGDTAGVNECLREAVGLQEGKAEQHGVRVELDLADDLPRVSGGNGPFQVFMNLISNACDAMADRGGTLTITTRREGEGVAARFRDTGCGMPPEVVERMFTPFFTTKLPGKGMGLGLAVCRETISRLGGRIEVESTPGEGTTFLVVVPAARTGEAARP